MSKQAAYDWRQLWCKSYLRYDINVDSIQGTAEIPHYSILLLSK